MVGVLKRMQSAVWRRITLLIALTLISEVSVHVFDVEDSLSKGDIDGDTSNLVPYVGTVTAEEYIRHIHSMYDAYRSDVGAGGRLIIETNALIDTKYRTWKRNADLINSLLALPKGMNDAGR